MCGAGARSECRFRLRFYQTIFDCVTYQRDLPYPRPMGTSYSMAQCLAPTHVVLMDAVGFLVH